MEFEARVSRTDTIVVLKFNSKYPNNYFVTSRTDTIVVLKYQGDINITVATGSNRHNRCIEMNLVKVF